MLRLGISFLSLLLMLCSNASHGEELVFPFTIDQNVKNEDWGHRNEIEIQNDKWFNAPPTRLELLTFVIDQHFQKDFARSWDQSKGKIEGYFDLTGQSSYLFEDAHFGFNSAQDSFFGTVKIRSRSKPKKPMKEICSELLDVALFPLFGAGYAYQNNFLGPFIQKGADDPEILRVVDKLRKSIIVNVILEAWFDNGIYVMGCYKTPEEKGVHFFKKAIKMDLK
jgi:hypothetical protein